MTRIFTPLAVVAVVLMGITAVLGLNIGDLPTLVREGNSAERAKDHERLKKLQAEVAIAKPQLATHRLAGLGTAIFVMMVHSLAITYFVGTTRWCREVAETYGLAPSFVERSQTNKRRNFPWAFLGMLTVILIAAFGALADPSIDVTPDKDRAAFWMEPHLIAALLGTCLTAVCAYFEAGNLNRQGELINEMMGEVARVRKEKGLETE